MRESMAQKLLFPDPRPLDRRLGRKFFLRAPRRPGVYLMKDADDRVLYVGKAKDLKQRLNNYRVANPDRMPRRHLKMVRDVARIEFQFCPSERAALRRESRLLRSLKPRFNRAGVWPGRSRFVVWRMTGEKAEIGVMEVPEAGWRRAGPFNSAASVVHECMVRLSWLACNPQVPVAQLHEGWLQGRVPAVVEICRGAAAVEVLTGIEGFFWNGAPDFVAWLEFKLRERTHPFERAAIAADIEQLSHFLSKAVRPVAGTQLGLL
jgi:predicted GIY-YIG superfamily endonuclease